MATTALKRALQPVKTDKLDRVPPGYWAAIVDGCIVVWVLTLKRATQDNGTKRLQERQVWIIKFSSHDLLVV